MLERHTAVGLQGAKRGSFSFPVGAQRRVDENIEHRAVAP